MKKIGTVLCGLVIGLSLFVTTGNTAKAAELTQPAVAQDDDCACHNVTPVVGSERNKIVASIISSDVFKTVKKDLKEDGFKWDGANTVEVLKHNTYGIVIVGVPFENKQGLKIMAVFFDGVFMGTSPVDGE